MNWKKTIVFVSVLLPITFWLLSFYSWLGFPDYSIEGNFLSDLGVGSTNAWAFNLACIAAGMAISVMGVFLGKVFDVGIVQKALFFFAGVFLAGVGLFPASGATEFQHLVSASSFFLIMGLSLAFFSFKTYKESKVFGIITLAIGLSPLLFTVFGLTPIIQKTVVGLITAWFFGFALFLYKVKKLEL